MLTSTKYLLTWFYAQLAQKNLEWYPSHMARRGWRPAEAAAPEEDGSE